MFGVLGGSFRPHQAGPRMPKVMAGCWVCVFFGGGWGVRVMGDGSVFGVGMRGG